MWVVKLGGSLYRDPRLPHWLQMLAEFGRGRVTVVPGGAAFAEAVREAQAHWGFDDLAAHNMAVLAMAQTAQMLHALEPRFVLVANEPEIRGVLHAGHPALWLPLSLLRDAPDLLTSWEVTSDSLALWLARHLNAERLVLVKACVVDRGSTLADLARMGVLDHRFAQWAHGASFMIEVVQGDEIERVRDALLGTSSLVPPIPPLAPSSPDGRPTRARRKPRA
jgi:aspartokinase-like uncharacterized kinase